MSPLVADVDTDIAAGPGEDRSRCNVLHRHVRRLRRNAQAKRKKRNACSHELIHFHDPPVILRKTINHRLCEMHVPDWPQFQLNAMVAAGTNRSRFLLKA